MLEAWFEGAGVFGCEGRLEATGGAAGGLGSLTGEAGVETTGDNMMVLDTAGGLGSGFGSTGLGISGVV